MHAWGRACVCVQMRGRTHTLAPMRAFTRGPVRARACTQTQPRAHMSLHERARPCTRSRACTRVHGRPPTPEKASTHRPGMHANGCTCLHVCASTPNSPPRRARPHARDLILFCFCSRPRGTRPNRVEELSLQLAANGGPIRKAFQRRAVTYSDPVANSRKQLTRASFEF